MFVQHLVHSITQRSVFLLIFFYYCSNIHILLPNWGIVLAFFSYCKGVQYVFQSYCISIFIDYSDQITNRPMQMNWWGSIISMKPVGRADKSVVAQIRLNSINYLISQLMIYGYYSHSGCWISLWTLLKKKYINT